MAVVAAGCRSALVRLHGPFFSFLAQMGVCEGELTSVCCIFLVLPGNNKGYLKGFLCIPLSPLSLQLLIVAM